MVELQDDGVQVEEDRSLRCETSPTGSHWWVHIRGPVWRCDYCGKVVGGVCDVDAVPQGPKSGSKVVKCDGCSREEIAASLSKWQKEHEGQPRRKTAYELKVDRMGAVELRRRKLLAG